MTYNKKNLANNATCGLQFWIDEDSMIFFATGNYNRFSTSNFIIEMATFDTTGKVIARENMLIASRSGNQFTIDTRAIEPVPIDDDQTSNIQQALPFVATNTIIKQVYSAKFGEDLQDEVIRLETDKLNKSVYNSEKIAYSASSTWNDDYSATISDVTSLTDWQTFKIKVDVANTWSATLNINWLWAKTLKKLKSSAFADLETGDLIANQIFFATYNSSSGWFFQFSVDPAKVTIPDVASTKSTLVAWENITAWNPVRFWKSVSWIISTYWSITNQAQPADNETIFSFVAELNKINSITLRKFSNYNITSWTVFLEIRNSANNTLLYTSSSSWNVADGTYVPFTFTWRNLVVWQTYNVRVQFTPQAWWGFYTGALWYYRSFNYDNIEDNTKLYKSSALYYFMAQIDWFATNSVNSWDNILIDTTWINNNQISLTAGLVYYLANTAWTISNTPGTNIVIVWKAVSATWIEIYLDSINQQTLITPTVWASPYTYQNTTWRPVVVSITGGTVSQVAMSRDNTNFYQTARATNTFVYLGINDYVKITYSVAPVLKTFTF